MMSDWKECTIGEIASVKGGKRLPKGVNLITEQNAHPYIRIRDLTEKTLELKSSYEYVDNETQKCISRYIVGTGDILISIVGTIGLVAVVGESLNGANLTENCVKLIDIREDVDREYLYYFLVSNMGQDEIKKGTVGAVQPKLPIKNIQSIKLYLPHIDIQKRISGLLSAIDCKIAQNTAINENLEQQAQAIYKSMFISAHYETDRIGLLSELISVKYGKDHKKLDDGIYPVYGSGGIMRYVEKPIYEKESVLIPRKGSLNNVMYVDEPFWSVDTMFYTEMKMPNVAKYVFHFVKNKDLASLNAGSAVPSMTTDILNSMEVRIPSAERLAEFEEVVAPLYRTMKDNIRQCTTLASLRDTLLPKLMNGEIDVSAVKL